MSANKNSDAMTNAQGQFKNKVAPSEPVTTKGHAPGVKVGSDRLPEFHAKTFPPGTAPADQTFRPQPTGEISSQAHNHGMQSATAASDTLPGATSADVHKGLGHPGQGQTSQERHGAHKHVGAGLEGVGANPVDPRHKHMQDREHQVGHRGVANDPVNYTAAEDTPTVSAVQLASERR